VCLFLLQFGLFWSVFQARLVYFREIEVATLIWNTTDAVCFCTSRVQRKDLIYQATVCSSTQQRGGCFIKQLFVPPAQGS